MGGKRVLTAKATRCEEGQKNRLLESVTNVNGANGVDGANSANSANSANGAMVHKV